jgi:hypothetical protein
MGRCVVASINMADCAHAGGIGVCKRRLRVGGHRHAVSAAACHCDKAVEPGLLS